jgi:hypothetical protein
VIVDPRHAHLIKTGAQTLLIRPKQGPRKPYRPGKAYPVQVVVERRDEWTQETSERRETRCHVAVVEVDERQLHRATDDDARRAGFPGRDQLFDWWRERHGHRPELEVGGRTLQVDTPVWVVTFKLDERRFLVDGARAIDPLAPAATDTRGYVHSAGAAMPEEPEAVDEDTQEQFSVQARARFEQGRRGEIEHRQARTRAAKLKEIQALARREGIDLEDEMARIDRELEAMRRKVDRAA